MASRIFWQSCLKHRKNRTAVNKAKIALNNSYLEWTSLQKELLRNVESAYLDAVSAQAQYLSDRKSTRLNSSHRL